MLAALAGVFAACGSSSSDPPDVAGSCRAIAGACHRYDQGGGLAHECHELGHAGDDAACGPKKDECLAACPPVEAGADAGQDGSSASDGGADGGPSADADAGDPCATYCQCMQDTCSTQAGYPFATPADCASACAQQAAEERACWPVWCAQAKSATTTKAHLCEHAWGKFGLDECDTL